MTPVRGECYPLTDSDSQYQDRQVATTDTLRPVLRIELSTLPTFADGNRAVLVLVAAVAMDRPLAKAPSDPEASDDKAWVDWSSRGRTRSRSAT